LCIKDRLAKQGLSTAVVGKFPLFPGGIFVNPVVWEPSKKLNLHEAFLGLLIKASEKLVSSSLISFASQTLTTLSFSDKIRI